MEQRIDGDRELELLDIIDMLWSGKLIIVLVLVAAVIAGAGAYLVLPRTYEVTAKISPMRQADFANFLSLANAEVFPYKAEDLSSGFADYLTDGSLLAKAAEKSGAIKHDGLSDAQYRAALASMLSSVSFSSTADAPGVTHMRVRGDDELAVAVFVRQALEEANAAFAAALNFEVGRRIAADRDAKSIELARLQGEIKALREEAEVYKSDRIEWLIEQAKIARSFDLDGPIELKAPGSVRGGDNIILSGDPSQISAFRSSNNDSNFFRRGYLAIEEEIKLLKERNSLDPFIEGLRNLQKAANEIQNDEKTASVERLLQGSRLNDPTNLKLAQYDTQGILAKKVAPRLKVFALGSVLLGLVLGSIIALLRGAYARRRRI